MDERGQAQQARIMPLTNMDNEVRAQYAAAQAAMPDVTPVTVLHIGAEQTVIAQAPDRHAVLELGSARTAATFFRHTPPTALELERAIDVAEDELGRARALVRGGSALFTTDRAVAHTARLAGICEQPVADLPRAAVERLFERLAAVALGRPASAEGLPTDPAFAATLLILRECLHHLDFASIHVKV